MFMQITLAIYIVANVYLLRRGWQALAGTGIVRQAVLIGYLIFSYSYFLWHKLERGAPDRLKETVCALGSFYVGVMLYLVLFTLTIDLLRLGNRFFRYLPGFVRENPLRAKRAAFVTVLGMTLAVNLAGWAHARHVRIKTMDIRIAKDAGEMKSLNLVCLADTHVGPFLRTSRLERIIGQVNALHPDIVLLLGDLMNEEALVSERERLPGVLREISAPLGVYACIGNHERFLGLKNSLEMFRRSRITVLQDQVELVADSFYLVGRNTRSYFGGTDRRMPLRTILQAADSSRPIIVMDHSAGKLDDAVQAGIDLQLSGHTHGGQVFPVTVIDNLFYELSHGYARKGDSQFYVTSGVGVWAPAIRIGTTGEVVNMRITFGSRRGSDPE